jgi:hypothetical protein
MNSLAVSFGESAQFVLAGLTEGSELIGKLIAYYTLAQIIEALVRLGIGIESRWMNSSRTIYRTDGYTRSLIICTPPSSAAQLEVNRYAGGIEIWFKLAARLSPQIQLPSFGKSKTKMPASQPAARFEHAGMAECLDCIAIARDPTVFNGPAGEFVVFGRSVRNGVRR